jgi:hypothetical protein
MSNFLRPLNRTGLVEYVWDGYVGNDIDLQLNDPKKYTSNAPGRNCIGIYCGSDGYIVAQVNAGGNTASATKNILISNIKAGTYIPISASKILKSGKVVDVEGNSVSHTSTAYNLLVYYEI